ncbi:MAG TPA: proton-conducting transporter membrane subunit [Polyangia bacterium]|nr:proton-conducting transporter membrane subunit [Polyangia bacterium]
MNSTLYNSVWLTPTGTTAALWLLPAFPVLGAIVSGLLGGRLMRRFGGRAVGAVAAAAMVATLIAAAVLVGGTLLALPEDGRRLTQTIWSLFSVGGIRVDLGLALDPLSAVMVALIAFLGTLIHLYAAVYMKDDPGAPRFFAFLNLFVASMLVLVLGDGFVPLFFGWEGVGACSYVLIGFWYRRPAAADAATKAFIVNRVGDAAFIAGIALLLWGLGGVTPMTGVAPGNVGQVQVVRGSPPARDGAEPVVRARQKPTPLFVGPTLQFAELRDQLIVQYRWLGPVDPVNNPEVRPAVWLLSPKKLGGMPLFFVVCLLLFLGAAGKSAQVPLFAWLPDAMAGPTPVSALIHAATMVTAGVYLLARLSFLFALSPGALTVIAVAGTLTAVVGATAALVQNDLKRALAYSTVSQLGYMFVGAATGGAAGIFHVVTHGFFKACLFLAAGLIIHAAEEAHAADPQDLRGLRALGLGGALPWTRRAYLIACVALAGLPVASGFFSKDQILTELALGQGLLVSPALLLSLLALTSFLTSLYAFRTYFLMFGGAPDGSAHAAHPPSPVMTGVVVILAAGAIVVGPWLGWPSNWGGHAQPILERFLAPIFGGNLSSAVVSAPVVVPEHTRAAVEWGFQAGGVVLAILGFALARVLYRNPTPAAAPTGLRAFFVTGWRFDDVYRVVAVRPVWALSRLAAWMDRGVLDRLVDGVATQGVRLARWTGAFDGRVIDAGVNGASDVVLAAGRRASRFQNGRINSYVVVVAAGVAALVVLICFLFA